MGLDDIVTLGYRNEVNLMQLKQYIKMESAEEIEFKRKKRDTSACISQKFLI